MKRARLAVVVFIILAGTTGTSFQRTDELLWMCEGRDSESGIPEIDMLRCSTYLDGMSDLNTVIQSHAPGAALFCQRSSPCSITLPGPSLSNFCLHERGDGGVGEARLRYEHGALERVNVLG